LKIYQTIPFNRKGKIETTHGLNGYHEVYKEYIMTGKERIAIALDNKEPDRVPTFEWFIDKTIGLALTGTDDIVDIVDTLDIDGINIRPDYSFEEIDSTTYIDEWGIKRKITGDVLAARLSSPIADIKKHNAYQFPEPDADHRFRTLEWIVKKAGKNRAVIFNIRDGFSDMRDLLGYEEALVTMITEPSAFRDLLNRVVEYNFALAKIAVEQFDIQIIATTDDIANAGSLLMRPETYFEMIGPAFKKIICGFKELGAKVIKHCDGDCSAVIDFWIESGIDCLDPVDPGAGFDMGYFKEIYGNKIALKGNIDCTGNLCYGSPEEVDEEVLACIRKGAPGGGFILSTSNTVHQGVKPENYRAMLSALLKYGDYSVPVKTKR
jgi:uroporphyrinogen decarboxylase